MSKLTKEEQIQKIDSVLEKLNSKDFNAYFLVIDTKGNASGSLEYQFQLAYKMMNLGYKTTMCYIDINEEEDKYVGPFGWLDEKYEKIPMTNIKDENAMFGPEDFIFVPEILSDALIEMKGKVNSKKILIVNDYKRISDFFPAMVNMNELGVHDCITTSVSQKEKIKSLFPELMVHVISPYIENKFRPYDGAKKLTINIISRNPSDRNRIMKEFYWKYPVYRWVSFRDLRGMSQDLFSECLRDTDLTIWIDDNTEFGYSCLEALKCGNIVLAKIPNNITDWMEDEENKENLSKSCLWFRSIDDVPDMLSSLVRSWTLDRIPSEVYNRYKTIENKYTSEEQEKEVNDVIVKEIYNNRIDDFNELKRIINSNKE